MLTGKQLQLVYLLLSSALVSLSLSLSAPVSDGTCDPATSDTCKAIYMCQGYINSAADGRSAIHPYMKRLTAKRYRLWRALCSVGRRYYSDTALAG